MTGTVALRPSCPACGEFLELRPTAGQTPEQKFCGAWYDHRNVGLNCGQSKMSVLWMSPQLIAQHESTGVAL